MVIFRQFTHLIASTLVGVFVGNGQHLIVSKWRNQRDVTQLGFKTVLALGEAFGTAQHIIIRAALQPERTCKHIGRLVGFAQRGRRFYAGKERVGSIVGGRPGGHGGLNIGVAPVEGCRFGKVSKAHHVPKLIGGVGAVGDVHFKPRNGYARRDNGQTFERSFVVVTKKLRQKKVAVLVVLIGPNLEGPVERATPQHNLLLSRPLLRQHGGSV